MIRVIEGRLNVSNGLPSGKELTLIINAIIKDYPKHRFIQMIPFNFPDGFYFLVVLEL